MSVELIRGFNWEKIFNAALSNGGWLAEVFFEDSRTVTLTNEVHRLERPVAGRDTGFGIRILFDYKTVYGYSTELTEESALKLAKMLSKGVSGNDRSEVVYAEPEIHVPVYQIVKPYDSVDLTDKAALLEKAAETAWQVDKRIRQVKTVYSERSQDVFIANSLGKSVIDTRNNVVMFCQVVAADGNVIQTGYQPIGGGKGLEIFDEQPVEEVGKEAAGRAILMLEAKPAPGGRMPVVLGGSAGGTMIHEAVGHGLEADLAYEGLSVYTKKLGVKVASDLVTVVDDATMPAVRGSFGFDDEGTPAQKTILIENGELKSYMTDQLYSKKGSYALTGNGRRESFRHTPIVRMSNTFIAPGKTDPDQIVEQTDKGLFVAKMGGGQVNTANGEFVFEVSEGYLIENGKIGQAVRGATLVGNGPEALMNIDMVGSDLGFSIGTCGKDGQGVPVSDAQPTLRIKELLVGGAV